MGRIRTDEIKKITKLIIGKYTLSRFNTDFANNKIVLHSFPEEFPSPKILNRVAGYIAFLVKKSKEEEKRLLNPVQEEEEEEDYDNN